MADEGSQLIMTELLLQEKELKEKVAALEKAMQAPVIKLRKAKAIMDKAKAHFDQCAAEVRPSDTDADSVDAFPGSYFRVGGPGPGSAQ